MKNIIYLLFLAAVITGFFIAYKTPFSFCDSPRTYKIGNIDPRFKLSKDAVEKDVDKAASILTDAYGKELFQGSTESGEITINFEYDERTALDASIDKAESQLTKIDKDLEEKISAYKKAETAFLQRLDDFNSKVKHYNDIGGAPPDQYEVLIYEQKELKAEGNALNARAKALNLEVNNYNLSISALNRNVTEFNDALNQKPEEGYFDGEKNTITVYFVNSNAELVHTLTHELGHAIGMNHVDDPKAIMYPKTSEYIKLTEMDREELDKACQSFPLLEYWIYKSKLEITNFTEEFFSAYQD